MSKRKQKEERQGFRGITTFREEPASEWVDYKGQSVPTRFHAETTLDFDILEEEVDPHFDELVSVPIGLFRPYERVTFAFDGETLAVARLEVIPWEGRPVTDASTRDRGLLELGRSGLDRLARGAGDGWGTLGEPQTPGVLSAVAARRRTLDSIGTSARGGRPAMGSDEIRRVAEVYLAAEGRGESPAKAVCESEGLSRDQANRRIKRARERGLLPAYERGGKQ